MQAIRNSNQWYDAIGVWERYEALNGFHSRSGPSDQAGQTLEEWAVGAGYDSPDDFRRALLRMGYCPSFFEHCLNISADELASKIPQPDWLSQIFEAYIDSNETVDPDVGKAVRNYITFNQVNRLIWIAERLLSRFVQRTIVAVREIQSRFPEGPLPPDALNLIVSSLPKRLIFILSRISAFELYYQKVQSPLDGGSPEERYDSFIGRIQSPDFAIEFLHDFPVLARYLSETLMNWSDSFLELILRLTNDWTPIQKILLRDNSFVRLAAIQFELGDMHRGGRSTSLLQFSDGNRIIYKPRPVEIDSLFTNSIEKILQKYNFKFESRAILPRHRAYGWESYVPNVADSDLKPNTYYRNAGGLLCLAHVFGAVDIHFENVRSSSRNPHFVDLETLFHPPSGKKIDLQLDAADVAACVLRVGYLPRRVSIGNSVHWYDYSGLGAVDNQDWLLPGDFISNVGTDEMLISQKTIKFGEVHNRPHVGQDAAKPDEHIEDIVDGYSAAFQAISNISQIEWSDICETFRSHSARVILLETLHYGNIIRDILHPSLLSSAVKRDSHVMGALRSLRSSPVGNVEINEATSLVRLDIPYFYTPIGDCTLATSSSVIPDFFEIAPSQFYFDRALLKDPSNCFRQISLIRLAFAARADLASLQRPQRSVYWRPSATDNWLEIADEIANRICDLSFVSGTRRTWFALQPSHHDEFILQPAGVDLYSGISGIVLFLSTYMRYRSNPRVADLLDNLIEQLLNSCRVENVGTWNIGGFSGSGGVLYGISHVAEYGGRHNLEIPVSEIADAIRRASFVDESADIIGGSAGAICGLLKHLDAANDSDVHLAAEACGNRLLQLAKKQDVGVSWNTMGTTDCELLGFSHGTSGISLALLRLGHLLGNARFTSAGLEGVNYLLSRYDVSHNERIGFTKDPCFSQTTWCHGASGIGSALIEIQKHAPMLDLQPCIASCIESTIRNSSELGHSLCHGQFGNWDLLIQGFKSGNHCEWVNIETMARSSCLQLVERGLVSGVPYGYEVPSLMVGSAGIGYQLLRILDPLGLPSILILE